ncbi:class I SAM-dependent methyltransferase [Mycobacterium sp. NPDC050551]|uniref:class I SAM-dependent methyltransferase n=1 Tax=Mycobacterium sp. NPDC050551 TaxID=3155407 RepID=UPI0034199583
MPDVTPTRSVFDDAYRSGTPPWVIDGPQPAVVELERRGLIRGQVLDAGCGAGEHTILLAGLGYDVIGIDFSPHAVRTASDNAAARGVSARFEVADALELDGRQQYDAIVDSALFHVFDVADRARYVAALHRACRPDGLVHVLALSDAGRGFGPQVSEADIRGAFAGGWTLEALDTATYHGVVGQAQSEAYGLPVGTRVEEPAWLATVRHVAS